MVSFGDDPTSDTISDAEVDLDQVLAQLTAKILAHTGEFILMIQRTISSEPGPGGCFAPDRYYHREVLRSLGVIAATEADFALSGDAQELPTVHFCVETSSSQGSPTVEEGNWPYRHFSIDRHGRSLTMKLPLNLGLQTAPSWRLLGFSSNPYEDEKTLEIVVGDESVEAWFRSERPTIIWPEKNPVWLQEAAEILGRPLAATPELDAKRHQERADIIQTLWRLNDEAAGYRRRLAQNLEARRGSGIRARSGTITLIEDDDDLRVVSMGTNYELDRLIARIKSLIVRARELGLGQHPFVTAFGMFYQVD